MTSGEGEYCVVGEETKRTTEPSLVMHPSLVSLDAIITLTGKEDRTTDSGLGFENSSTSDHILNFNCEWLLSTGLVRFSSWPSDLFQIVVLEGLHMNHIHILLLKLHNCYCR